MSLFLNNYITVLFKMCFERKFSRKIRHKLVTIVISVFLILVINSQIVAKSFVEMENSNFSGFVELKRPGLDGWFQLTGDVLVIIQTSQLVVWLSIKVSCILVHRM